MSYIYEYPRPAVTTDAVVFCVKSNKVSVLLIQRKNEPFKDKWALPGGFVDMDEDISNSVIRELEEETGLVGIKMTQLGTFGSVDRDPRHRTITVAYWGVVSEELAVEGYDDAKDAKWFSLQNLPDLAFDHDEVLALAQKQLNL